MFQIWKSLTEDELICKTRLFVPDKPGSLANLANAFGRRGINITYFYYNRSEHPNRVLVDGRHKDIGTLRDLEEALNQEGYFIESHEEDLQITNLNNIIKISAYLENRPGTLADLAELLKIYEANVIYMIYNEAASENKAQIAFYVKDREQVRNLLHRMNSEGYQYSVEYSGSDEEITNRVIGLNLIEKFYLRLSRILEPSEIEDIRKVIDSSKSISETLIKFNKEAGKNFEEAEVFEKLLAFAISSRTKVGEHFSYIKLPTLAFGELLLHTFKPPTGGNVYIFEYDGHYTMIDGTYGIYYEDLKKMLRENGIEPSKIERIYISHADADHAGVSGYFEEEFGTEVFMHRKSFQVILNENRSFGVDTSLSQLNENFTLLVNAFTKSKYPKNPKFFEGFTKESLGEFPIIDKFSIGDGVFKVIESLGGHIPGQVFFLSEEYGLLFTADYLLNLKTLKDEEKKLLSIPKFLMTSTNVDSRLFRKEMKELTAISIRLNSSLKDRARGLLIFPGHGDYYPGRILLS